MKGTASRLFFTLLLFPLILPNGACRVQGPAMQFRSVTHDFGAIAEGASFQHAFEFTNNGTEMLFVSEVSATCGCTVVGDFDREVRPGGRGKIPIRFDSAGFEGPFEKPIIVKANVTDVPERTLTLAGTVKVFIGADPPVLWLGTVDRRRKTALEGRMILTNRLPNPVNITGVKPSDARAEARIETIRAGAEYALVIKVKPPFKAGPVKAAVHLTTDSGEIPEYIASYSYYMTPLIAAYPNPLFVRRKSIERGDEQTITIECEPGCDVRFSNLAVNDDRIGVSGRETGGNARQGKKIILTVRFPRDFQFDPDTTLVISFRARNLPDNPLISIPILESRE